MSPNYRADIGQCFIRPGINYENFKENRILTEAEILIKIEYIGFFKIATKKSLEEIRVPLLVKDALDMIHQYLKVNYQIDKNLTILINNQSVSVFRKDNNQLKEFTKFTIIPSLSGG